LETAPLDAQPLEFTANPMYVPYSTNTNNTLSFLGLEPLVILYQANQPADSQLWDSNFTPISLFGIDEFLTSDTKNIVFST